TYFYQAEDGILDRNVTGVQTCALPIFLELDAELTVTLHIQTVDQLRAIKTIKGKISDIGRMKAEEQKKAVRAGYDMEILPPDLRSEERRVGKEGCLQKLSSCLKK